MTVNAYHQAPRLLVCYVQHEKLCNCYVILMLQPTNKQVIYNQFHFKQLRSDCRSTYDFSINKINIRAVAMNSALQHLTSHTADIRAHRSLTGS